MNKLWGPSVPWQGSFEETLLSYPEPNRPIFQTSLGAENTFSIPRPGRLDAVATSILDEKRRIIFHSPHTVNLGKSDNRGKGILQSLLNKSAEIDAKNLKIGVIAHIGRGEGSTLENVIEKVSSLIIPEGITLYLENSAGQGYELGWNLDSLEELFENLPKKIKLCIDTQHSFASGLCRWQSPEEIDDFFNSMSENLWRRFRLVHLNDSKKPFGSKVDRHEKLLQGYIWGEEKAHQGLEFLLSFSLENKLPMILETPDSQGDLERLFKFAKKHGL